VGGGVGGGGGGVGGLPPPPPPPTPQSPIPNPQSPIPIYNLFHKDNKITIFNKKYIYLLFKYLYILENVKKYEKE